MGDNRRFPSGSGLPRDNAVDTDGKGNVGAFVSYGNQFEHDENEGPDEPIGTDPNAAGATPVFPEWWTQDEAE